MQRPIDFEIKDVQVNIGCRNERILANGAALQEESETNERNRNDI